LALATVLVGVLDFLAVLAPGILGVLLRISFELLFKIGGI
jgi:hypothetical protein